jgi:hypothetical protein
LYFFAAGARRRFRRPAAQRPTGNGTDAFILANVKLVLSPLDQWTADVHAIDAVAARSLSS